MARRRDWQPRTNAQWGQMLHRARADWLADLDDAQLIRQAGERAAATGGTVPDVLRAWVVNGLIDRRVAQRLIAEVTP